MENNISQVAQTIYQQIGHKAFFMLGAYNIVAGKNDLTFRIRGRAHKGINCIKVIYTYDEYRMEFWKIPSSPMNIKLVDSVDGVYFDMLHQIIEDKTGLYTKL